MTRRRVLRQPCIADQRAAFRAALDGAGLPPFTRAPIDCRHYDDADAFAVVETRDAYGCRLCGKVWSVRTASGAFQPPPNLCRGCGDAAARGAFLCSVCWSVVAAPIRDAFRRARLLGSRTVVDAARAAAVRSARDGRRARAQEFRGR